MARARACEPGNLAGFGWFAIARIGLVQAAIGALVMLATTVLNRIMVVELSLAAAIPAGLVAWHYGVQMARPLWGHGSDRGARRTPWIIGGLVVLGSGGLLATQATLIMVRAFVPGFALAVIAYALIGIGVGAGGTSALALLASGVAPARRAAAAAVTWIMMVAGIVASAIVVGSLLKPYSPARLFEVAGGLAAAMVALVVIATFRLERQAGHFHDEAAGDAPAPGFRAALAEIWAEDAARRFTIFIFVSMIAFSMQDLILEPFAGLIFGMAPGESTRIVGQFHQGGILIGMIAAGIGGSAFTAMRPDGLRAWVVGGCLASGLGLAGLGFAAVSGPPWPFEANLMLLGLGNGVFAVASIGAMMGLAGAGETTREGVRMGVWGASQAIAFGLGGLLGAVGLDLARLAVGRDGPAFQMIFAIEAGAFLLSALLAVKATGGAAMRAGAAAHTREKFA